MVNRKPKPLLRYPVKRKNKSLAKLAIAFAIVLVALGLYLKAYPYTNEAKQRQQLESVQHQLIEKTQQLEQEQTEGEAQYLEQQRQLEETKKKLEETEKALQAKRSTPKAIAATPPKYTPSGNKEQWMSAAGIPSDVWWAVDYIVSRESSWNPSAVNKSSGACGLVQSLPCSKLGPNWSDPVVALKWQYQYVTARYGGYPQAVTFWKANSWY